MCRDHQCFHPMRRRASSSASWRAGARGLTQPPSQGGTARRERELLNEITRLRAALGEAHLALIVGRRKRKRP